MQCGGLGPSVLCGREHAVGEAPAAQLQQRIWAARSKAGLLRQQGQPATGAADAPGALLLQGRPARFTGGGGQRAWSLNKALARPPWQPVVLLQQRRTLARVLVGWGVPEGSSTSHITSTSSPPRMGSGTMHTGLRAGNRGFVCVML
jgi:hypothetical protein